ncbi:TonB family protein [Sphingomonadaceae bacterium jetA1]|jgi:protein TonB|uniref:energy transducer TonB family protein n=1 Tax=Facivitalis istanbulensis TaxID=3075838 RepID=UPI00348C89AD
MLWNKMRDRSFKQTSDPNAMPLQSVEDRVPRIECYGYRADHGNRLAGVAATIGIYALILGAAFLTIDYVTSVQVPPPALAVFDVNLPASPRETPAEEKDAPRPIKKTKDQPDSPKVRPIEPKKIQVSAVMMPVPVAVPKPVDPGQKEPEMASPRPTPTPTPTPPVPQASSNAPDTWEGRVLAALNKLRRYPRMAMVRRQQGVPYVRIVIDRDGRVLSSRLERASGFSDLDREAVALPKRASPLPGPPADKPGDTLELVVPVEFVLK